MIFPEGTSSPGNKVLPYKSALFEMVMEDDLRETCLIQPVTLAFCRSRTHQPLTNIERDYFAWYGDMTLAPHLWDVFCLGGVEVDVIFHAPPWLLILKTAKHSHNGRKIVHQTVLPIWLHLNLNVTKQPWHKQKLPFLDRNRYQCKLDYAPVVLPDKAPDLPVR